MPSITVNGVVYELPPDDSQSSKVPQYNSAIQALATEAESPTPPKCRAYHSTTQSLTTATLTAIALNSERFDTDTIHDTATNNSRLTCKTAGLYLITGCLGYAAHATGERSTIIRLGGATQIGGTAGLSGGATLPTRHTVSTIYPLAVNDYVELVGYQSSGGALNTEQTANVCPEFSMVRLGA